MLNTRTRSPAPGGHQSGAVLLIALIVVLAMTMAGAALFRSVSTGNRVAGNLAFQQSATQSADVGIETAIAWLETNNVGNTLFSTTGAGAPVGYSAAREDPAPGVSWETFWQNNLVAQGRINTLAPDAAGNTVSYVIHRLCNSVGDPAGGAGCSVAPAVVGSEGCGMGSGTVCPKLPNQQYYRITARVVGPRNTSSFVQVVVAM